MMIFSWIGRNIKWFILAGIISFALKFGYDAYTDYQDMIAQQIEQAETIAELAGANAVNEATIALQREQARENELNRQVLEVSLRSSENRIDDLEGLLSRHDLEFLAINKPGLIERRINDATQDVFSDIECITDPSCVR